MGKYKRRPNADFSLRRGDCGLCETQVTQTARLQPNVDEPKLNRKKYHVKPLMPGRLIKNMVETNMNFTSVFDLSPTEKLQLVEDLWDDLATAPDAVPVHDWQKQELARRKANLLSNPVSELSWEEVKRRVRSHYGR